MSGNNTVHWQKEYLIEGCNPVLHIALIHRRTRVRQNKISGSDRMMVCKIDYDVAHGMCRAEMVNLNFMTADVNRETFRPNGFIECVIRRRVRRARTRECCADDYRVRPNHTVSPAMVEVIMRVHDPPNRRGGYFADFLQQLAPFLRIQSRVDHENAFVADQKRGIGAGVVFRDVSVEVGADFLDRSRGHGGSEKQPRDYSKELPPS